MSNDALIIQNAVKRQGKVETVSNISMTLDPGEIVALLGHNGAGKTTLIRMILGLARIDGGEISVFGSTPGGARARRWTAYLPEAVAFHKSLTGREQLRLFARLSGEPGGVIGPLLDRVGLTEEADRRIGTWSKGMRQRLGLAQVLLGKPRLALLDEPTSGLDPISRHDFYAIVDDLVTDGTSVLISSHALTELEARTDRIAILRKGKLVADDSLTNLRSRARLPTRLVVTAATEHSRQIATRLGGAQVNCRGVELHCHADGKMAYLRRIAELAGMIDDVDVIPPSLEDLYRHYAAAEDDA